MNHSYFIFWSDYDGTFLERFTSRQACFDRVVVLQEREKAEDYGTTIQDVVKGIRLPF